MIRKLPLFLLPVLLCVILSLPCHAEQEVLTPNDFESFGSWIRNAAGTDGFFSVSPAADGYALRFKDFVLYTDTLEWTEETVLKTAVLDVPPEEDGTYPDLKGIAVGTPVGEVLSRYPLDNPSLSGTREEAWLCLSGYVPGSAFTGVLYRDGQIALSAVYSLYEMAPGGVLMYSVNYAFARGAVSMIRVSIKPAFLSVRDAQKLFGDCADLMSVHEYSAYLPSSDRPAEPFNEEDLFFSGLDFLCLTPESAQAVLGDPADEVWAADGEAWLYTLSWEGLSVTFICDAEKKPLYAAGLFLDEDLLEGPRGLMPGLFLSDILARFYSDPASAPADDAVTELYRLDDGSSGQLEEPAEGLATVRYTYFAEDSEVLLRLYTESGTLKNLALQRKK